MRAVVRFVVLVARVVVVSLDYLRLPADVRLLDTSRSRSHRPDKVSLLFTNGANGEPTAEINMRYEIRGNRCINVDVILFFREEKPFCLRISYQVDLDFAVIRVILRFEVAESGYYFSLSVALMELLRTVTSRERRIGQSSRESFPEAESRLES